MKNWPVLISALAVVTSCLLSGIPAQAQATAPVPDVQGRDAGAKPISRHQLANRLRWLTNPDNRVKIEIRVLHALVKKDKDGDLQWKADDGIANQSLHVGDYLTIEVRNTGPAPVYVHLFDIDNDSVGQLWPSRWEARQQGTLPNHGKWVKLWHGSDTSVPSLFRVTSASLSDTYKLIASEEPVEFGILLSKRVGTASAGSIRGEKIEKNLFDNLLTERVDAGARSPFDDLLAEKVKADRFDIGPHRSLPGAWGTASIRFIETDIKPPVKTHHAEYPHNDSPRTFMADDIKPLVKASPHPEPSRGTVNVSVQIIDSSTREQFARRKNYALLFGSDDYLNWPHLSNPLHDTAGVQSLLASKYGFDAKTVANPTRQTVKDTLRQYQQLTYTDYDQLFVYFAGHGAFDATYTDQGYVITHDSPNDPDHYDECLSFNDLQQMLDKIPCKHIFLVLDTCYGGAFDPTLRHAQAVNACFILAANAAAPETADSSPADDSLSAPPDPASNPDYVETLMGDETRLFLSSGKKESVPDGAPGAGSPFARQLSQALRVGDRQKMLLFDDIKRFVFLAKPRPHASEFDNNKYGGDFVFIAH